MYIGDHPRSCGKDLYTMDDLLASPRITPACAGKTPWAGYSA